MDFDCFEPSLAGSFHVLERVGSLARQAELLVLFPELLLEPRALIAMLFFVPARAVSPETSNSRRNGLLPRKLDGLLPRKLESQSSRLMACCGNRPRSAQRFR